MKTNYKRRIKIKVIENRPPKSGNSLLKWLLCDLTLGQVWEKPVDLVTYTIKGGAEQNQNFTPDYKVTYSWEAGPWLYFSHLK